MKRLKISGWIVAALFFSGGLFAAQKIVTSDKTFEVVYFGETQIPGYEKKEASVKVFGSPAVKWQQASGTGKLLGWICIALIFVASYLTERFDGKFGLQLLLFVTPIILCMVFWFASYSASLDMGSLNCSAKTFVEDYKVNPALLESVRIGSTKNIKDESGLITKYFTKGK